MTTFIVMSTPNQTTINGESMILGIAYSMVANGEITRATDW